MRKKPIPPAPIPLQELQELPSSLPREVPFRYSNRFAFYFIWQGGWMLFALWAFFFGEGFTDSVAIPAIDAMCFQLHVRSGVDVNFVAK